MNEDLLLIRRIREDDLPSFRRFYERFFPLFCHFALRYLKNEDAAEDIVQDAFLSFWKNRKSMESMSGAKSWLYLFVKNHCLNYIRDNRKIIPIDYSNISRESFFRDNIIEEETYQLIYQAIRNLSPQGQRIIELSLDGLKVQEIADQLEVSINTVKTIKLRAFKSLRDTLQGNMFALFILQTRITRSN